MIEGLRQLFKRGAIIALLLFSSTGYSINGNTPKPINKHTDCITLFVYFDIDNTAQSYFNNITYFLNVCNDILPKVKNTVNIVLPEYVFENSKEQAEFKSRFVVDTNLWNINIILSDSLFNSFPDVKGLAKYRFYKSGIPIALGTCKWDDNLSEFKDKITCEQGKTNVEITLLDKTNIRKKVFSDNNGIEVIDSNKVLLLDDYYNKIILLDYANKKLTLKEYPCNFFNPIEVYCKYYSKNEEDCNIAKSHAGSLKRIAKEASFFTSAYIGDSNIFIAANFFAHRVNQADHTFINDIGKRDTIKKGEVVGNQLSVILKFDRELNFIEYIPILDDDLYNTKGKRIVAGVDFGFLIDNSGVMYSYLTPYETESTDKDLDYCIGKFSLNKDSCYVFNSLCKFPYPKNFKQREIFNAYIKIKRINEHLTYSFGTYDYYFVDSNAVLIDIVRDKNTLKKENILENLSYNEALYCNYYILGINKDINSNHIMVFFRVDNQFCIEVFDSEYKSIGYTVLNNYEFFPNPDSLMELIGVSFKDNILSFNYRDRGNIFLVRYKIEVATID
ncbi:MAG: hypothetical protein M9892_09240 [Bacteroidetes bacterium]|nr:hypothetical protein [Bacteroidota bacterium]